MDEWELYDLENDPDELNNLYSNKEYKDLIIELKKELRNLQKEYNMNKSFEELRSMTDSRIPRRHNQIKVR